MAFEIMSILRYNNVRYYNTYILRYVYYILNGPSYFDVDQLKLLIS